MSHVKSLYVEIKRDEYEGLRARIAELEASNAELRDRKNSIVVLQNELAALKAQQPSTGVVLPSENSVMRLVLREMGNSTHVRGTSNWCADIGMAVVREVASLNATRAELAALQAGQGEAVAWRVSHQVNGWKSYDEYPAWALGYGQSLVIQPLYTAPPTTGVIVDPELLEQAAHLLSHTASYVAVMRGESVPNDFSRLSDELRALLAQSKEVKS